MTPMRGGASGDAYERRGTGLKVRFHRNRPALLSITHISFR